MTHYELLKKIERKEENYYADPSSLNALRAVVELHKPLELISSSMCLECSSDEQTVAYPCPTIQAIEKELG